MLDSPRRTLAVQWLLTFLAIGLTARYAVTTWKHRIQYAATYPYSNVVLSDFRDTALLPARALAQGMNPYDVPKYHKLFPFAQEFDPYAPWWLTATSPLHWLSWDHASLIGSSFLATATATVAALIGWRVCLRFGIPQTWARTLPLACAAAIWAWKPVTVGQGLGNIGAVCALLAASCLFTRSTAWGAVLLALCWVKPQFALPLCFLLTVRGQWRTAVLGTVGALGASIPALIRLSTVSGGLWAWARTVLTATGDLSARGNGEPMAGRIDIAGFLSRLGIVSNSFVSLLLAVLVLGASAACIRHMDRRDDTWRAWLMGCMAALIALPHLHYDAAMALPPALAFVVAQTQTSRPSILGTLRLRAGTGRRVRAMGSPPLAAMVFLASAMLPGRLLGRHDLLTNLLAVELLLSWCWMVLATISSWRRSPSVAAGHRIAAEGRLGRSYGTLPRAQREDDVPHTSGAESDRGVTRMKDRLRSFSHSRNFILLLDTAVTSLTTMLLVVAAARALDASELTHFSLAQLVTVTTVSMMRAAIYSPAMAAQRTTGTRRIPLSWLASIGIPLSLVLGAVISPFMERGHAHADQWFAILAFCILAAVAQDGARTVLVSRQRERQALISDSVVLTGIMIGFLLGLPNSAMPLLTYWALMGLIGLVIACSFIALAPPPTGLPAQTLRATWVLGRWAAVDVMLGSVATLLPFFVASAALGNNSAGVYRTLQTALGPLNIVHTTVVTAFGLDAWKSADLTGMRKLRSTVNRLTVILAAGGLAYAVVAELAMIKISGLNDSSLTRISIIMMVSATLGAANSAYNAAALALGFQRSGAVLRAIIVSITILISLPQSARSWVPWHDPIGSSNLFAAVVTFAGWAISYTLGSRRELELLEREASPQV